MVARIHSATLVGIDAIPIVVEAELSVGLPVFSVIGLGDTAVHEARYRVQASIRETGEELPHKRITVNLAPAAIRKDGAALDLPIALALLVAAGKLEERSVEALLAFGELSLSGELRSVRGVLPVVALARRLGLARVLVPARNAGEARAIDGIEIVPGTTLREVVAHLAGGPPIADPWPAEPPPPEPEQPDLADVRGQPVARRALEISAAGGHNLLLVGPPGSGKTMLARRLPSILPPTTLDEQIEVTKIHSAAGLTLGHNGLITRRPFRAPHHSISEAGLVGGGSVVRPGEVSLAHHGVLFLDEMPELPRRVLEALRQPLEDREVCISRVRQSVRMPASFILVGAANPCPCGWYGEPGNRCRCTSEEINRYRSRLSGALIDRIDMVVEAPALSPTEILSRSSGERSSAVRERVDAARQRALARGCGLNAALKGDRGKAAVRLADGGRALLASAMERLRLSARVIDRTLRVGRTIADLDGKSVVDEEAIREALRYRPPSGWVVKEAA